MSMTPVEEHLVYAAHSVAGQVRTHNEDAILCCPALHVWAVADGMGGHEYGEVASALALQALETACAAGEDLVEAVNAANRAVLAAAEQRGRGMGTTLVAAQFTESDFKVAWIGDSRAYRISAAYIEQLTHDHSWVQAMVDAGELSREDARHHPQRNVIFQCLGRGDQRLDVGLVSGSLGTHELLLLCSDGLTGELLDEQIQQLCTSADTLEAVVEQLIALANQMGGRDNISCIVLGRALTEPPVDARPRGFLSKLLKPLKPS